jgi:hypothetical protein
MTMACIIVERKKILEKYIDNRDQVQKVKLSVN